MIHHGQSILTLQPKANINLKYASVVRCNQQHIHKRVRLPLHFELSRAIANWIIEEEDQDHEHESEYPHASNPTYSGSQSSYPYQTNSGPAAPSAEMPRVADITSPHHANGSTRGAPRTSTSQTWQGGYPTPQRSNTAPTTNIYSVMEPRDAQNGAPDYYQNTSFTNGAVASNKRAREDDEADDEVKRAKTEHEEGGPVGGSSPYAVNNNRGPNPRVKR
jgi:hypothetical protein